MPSTVEGTESDREHVSPQHGGLPIAVYLCLAGVLESDLCMHRPLAVTLLLFLHRLEGVQATTHAL
jgi:hypothetical protein